MGSMPTQLFFLIFFTQGRHDFGPGDRRDLGRLDWPRQIDSCGGVHMVWGVNKECFYRVVRLWKRLADMMWLRCLGQTRWDARELESQDR